MQMPRGLQPRQICSRLLSAVQRSWVIAEPRPLTISLLTTCCAFHWPMFFFGENVMTHDFESKLISCRTSSTSVQKVSHCQQEQVEGPLTIRKANPLSKTLQYLARLDIAACCLQDGLFAKAARASSRLVTGTAPHVFLPRFLGFDWWLGLSTFKRYCKGIQAPTCLAQGSPARPRIQVTN